MTFIRFIISLFIRRRRLARTYAGYWTVAQSVYRAHEGTGK